VLCIGSRAWTHEFDYDKLYAYSLLLGWFREAVAGSIPLVSTPYRMNGCQHLAYPLNSQYRSSQS